LELWGLGKSVRCTYLHNIQSRVYHSIRGCWQLPLAEQFQVLMVQIKVKKLLFFKSLSKRGYYSATSLIWAAWDQRLPVT